MNGKLKKLISILLCSVMLLSCFSLAAAAADTQDIPIVTVNGKGATLVRPDGTVVYPFDYGEGVSENEYVASMVKPALIELGKGVLTGDYSSYCDSVYHAFADVFEDAMLDKDGNVADGSYPVSISSNFNPRKKTYGFTVGDYNFVYDWRLDPLETAYKLNDYIDLVLSVTGHSKIALIGRCLGANIVSAYLYKYGTDKIDTIIMNTSSAGGITLEGRLFTGDFDFDPVALDRYVTYYLENNSLTDDDEVDMFLMALVSMLSQAQVLGFGTDVLESILLSIKSDLVPPCVLATFGGYPSFWAMIGTEYYEQARDFVFEGRQEEYAAFIEKIDNYYYNVMVNNTKLLKDAEADGVKVAVICKYGFYMVPLTGSGDLNTDGRTELSTMSYGATCSDIDETLSEQYIEAAIAAGNGKYISPDKQIDASTCAFPDSTWFIKNLIHATFPSCVTKLMLEICRSKQQYTIDSNESYPQFMNYDEQTSTLSPLTEENDSAISSWTSDFFRVIFRFFARLFNLLAKLLSK